MFARGSCAESMFPVCGGAEVVGPLRGGSNGEVLSHWGHHPRKTLMSEFSREVEPLEKV
jgi:hypothetical protein